VTAGPAVDAVIEDLLPHLETGDILIDGGNSLYTDTNRRTRALADRGIRFMGVGGRGGEEGARHGPSLMLGGDADAWSVVATMLKSIAAKAPDGVPCCDWVGPEGAGHFVKMVHNGIEYGDMQVIAEAYDLMRRGVGMAPARIAGGFASGDEGRPRSCLVGVAAGVLARTGTGTPLGGLARSAPGKGTVIASMEPAEPPARVAEAVYARIVSSDPDRRKTASRLFPGSGDLAGVTVDDIEAALYASKIVSYSQGFRLMRAASTEY